MNLIKKIKNLLDPYPKSERDKVRAERQQIIEDINQLHFQRGQLDILHQWHKSELDQWREKIREWEQQQKEIALKAGGTYKQKTYQPGDLDFKGDNIAKK